MNLEVDPSRMDMPEAGIPIRAKGPDGSFGFFDIAHLKRESLQELLVSRGGSNAWAESLVLILLGHRP